MQLLRQVNGFQMWAVENGPELGDPVHHLVIGGPGEGGIVFVWLVPIRHVGHVQQKGLTNDRRDTALGIGARGGGTDALDLNHIYFLNKL